MATARQLGGTSPGEAVGVWLGGSNPTTEGIQGAEGKEYIEQLNICKHIFDFNIEIKVLARLERKT